MIIGTSNMSAAEFERFRALIYNHAGISLSPEKKIMVASRLAKRLDYYNLDNYGDYYDLALGNGYPHEFQTLVDILTTNETYFFREPKHFDFVRERILRQWRGSPFRAWSAACSSGEEVYSLAMVCAETLGAQTWEVMGSDLSSRVLEIARHGVYPMDRLEQMDPHLLRKYCLKGVRSQQGYFRVDAKLRGRVSFEQVNLMKPPPASLGKFDLIFLRNVLIYFDQDTKKQVVERLLAALKPGGYFFISHSESLHGISGPLQQINPSIYRKP